MLCYGNISVGIQSLVLLLLYVGPTDKKQVQMNRMHSLICNHAPQWGVKSMYLSSHFHAFMIICDFFYEKRDFH